MNLFVYLCIEIFENTKPIFKNISIIDKSTLSLKYTIFIPGKCNDMQSQLRGTAAFMYISLQY